MASSFGASLTARTTSGQAQTWFRRTAPRRGARTPIVARQSAATRCNQQERGHSAISGGGGTPDGLAYQDLSNRDLTKLKLVKTNLRKANFNNANMSGVSMFACLAKDATFVGTNLTGADLESGYFEDVDFTDAVLEGAYVNNAQFINVNIDNTDWTDVIVRKDVQKKLCSVAKGTNPKTGVDTKESLGCF